MTALSQDRLIRKEVALGAVRELPVNGNFIGGQIAPFLDVQSDDVIFSYITADTEGLVPARAADAESEMARKDDLYGSGRASIIDWAIKDHYSASDVTRYREYLRLADAAGGGSFPLTIGSMTEDWQSQLARDTARRRKKIDNRLEWLVMEPLVTGGIGYDDGKVKFNVDFARPAAQQDQPPPSGVNWDDAAGGHDPIGDVIAIDEFMWDTYGIRLGQMICSPKTANMIMNSMKFYPRTGLATPGGATPTDMRYLVDGWGPEAAKGILKANTGVDMVTYDAVYRTRALGTATPMVNRFMPENKVLFLPRADYVNEINDTQIGFAKMLTSPHPEGNFTAGYYEWERSTVDPWGYDIGVGIKAFPVFPHLDWTFVMDAW